MDIKDYKAPFSSSELKLIKLMKEQEDRNKLINKQLQPFVDIAKTFRISPALRIEASNSLQASLASRIEASNSLQASLASRIEASNSLQASFPPFSKQFLDFRSSAQKAFEQMQKHRLPMQRAIERIQKQTLPMQRALERIQKQTLPMQRALEQIQKQTLPMQKAMRQFHLDYFQTHEVFRRIIGVVKSIPREHLVKFHICSGNWLISNNDLLLKIDEHDSLEGAALADFIVDYYKSNDWARLEEVIQSWSNIIDKGLTDVFKSALDGTKSKIIIHLLTIQPLISQIEGLLRELHSILQRNENKILDSLSEDIKKKGHYPGIHQIVSSIAKSVDPLYAEIIIKVIYKEGLKFRNEIMHGDKDFLDYGNEEIFVRLVLYADFIIKFTNQIKTDVPRGRCA